MKNKNLFFVLDSRDGALLLSNKTSTLQDLDEDCERYIMSSGTAKECCDDCNEGSYGDNCVVANSKFEVQWQLFESGKWEVKK